MALFSGGLTQYMAGMWEFPRGNVFGATGLILIIRSILDVVCNDIHTSSGILAAYSTPEDFANAFGLYLITWLVAVVKRNNALTVFFSGLAITLLLLTVAQFNAAHITALTKASGVLGILTSLSAWYTSLAQILIPEQQPIFSLPLGIWRPRQNEQTKLYEDILGDETDYC
ncbi:GPR1/FUN34/yaaH family-domain-containing protein [Mycena galopus ATCC 62051]|nr:GPR1/FUN34/yaaH family-domain-containing protein [Mycena galopus ATCC 62051]